MTRTFLLLTLWTFLPLQAQTSPGTGTLQLTGSNVLSVDATAEVFGIRDMDSDTTAVSGTLEVDLQVNRSAAEVTDLVFTGGDLSFSDMDFQFSFSTGPIPLGSQTVATREVLGTPLTVGDNTAVQSDGGFSAAAHSVELDSGLITSEGSGGSFEQDLEDEPAEVAGRGNGSILLTATETRTNFTAYDVNLILPVDGEETVEDETTGATATLAISGSVNAAGQIRVFTDAFTQYAVETGLVDEDTVPSFTGDANGDGIQDGLAFALNLPAGATPAENLLRIDANRALRITLPEDGTNADVLVTASETLLPNSFEEIDRLEAGSSGETLIISATSADQRFFRLETIEAAN